MAYRPGYKRQGFWIAIQAAWDTAADKDIVWTKYRATNTPPPTGINQEKVYLGAIGSGIACPLQDADGHLDYVHVQPTATQTVTLPLTAAVLLNFGSFITQGYNDDAGSAGAEAEFIMPNVAECTMYATTMIRMSTYTEARAGYRGESMVLRDFNINFPAAGGGGSPSVVTATLNFIGGSASHAKDMQVSDEDDPVGTVYDLVEPKKTRGTTEIGTYLYIGNTVEEMVSSTINITNNAQIIPTGGTSVGTGATLGAFGVSGTVTLLDTDEAKLGGATAYGQLMDEIERATTVPILLEWWWVADEFIEIYAIITGVSGPQDVGGLNAYTFTWQMVSDGANPPFALRAGVSSDATWFDDQTPA